MKALGKYGYSVSSSCLSKGVIKERHSTWNTCLLVEVGLEDEGSDTQSSKLRYCQKRKSKDLSMVLNMRNKGQNISANLLRLIKNVFQKNLSTQRTCLALLSPTAWQKFPPGGETPCRSWQTTKIRPLPNSLKST